MKEWNITIKAEDEKSAIQLVETLAEAFKCSAKINETLKNVFLRSEQNTLQSRITKIHNYGN